MAIRPEFSDTAQNENRAVIELIPTEDLWRSAGFRVERRIIDRRDGVARTEIDECFGIW